MLAQPIIQPLILKRFSKSNKGILGRLYYNGDIVCHTLEHHSKCVPSGVYTLDCTYSPKFGRQLPLLIVPNRSGIRIHVGNSQQDTSGCILVGVYTNNYTLTSSRIVLNAIVPFIKHCNQIKIIDYYDRPEEKAIEAIF